MPLLKDIVSLGGGGGLDVWAGDVVVSLQNNLEDGRNLLPCDGSAVDESKYPDLYSVLNNESNGEKTEITVNDSTDLTNTNDIFSVFALNDGSQVYLGGKDPSINKYLILKSTDSDYYNFTRYAGGDTHTSTTCYEFIGTGDGSRLFAYVLAAPSSSQYQIITSTNGGTSWSNLDTFSGSSNSPGDFAISPNGNYAVLSLPFDSTGTIQQASSSNWSLWQERATNKPKLYKFVFDGDYAYGGYENGITKSYLGVSWSDITAPRVSATGFTSVVFTAEGDLVVVDGETKDWYWTADDGVTWKTVDFGSIVSADIQYTSKSSHFLTKDNYFLVPYRDAADNKIYILKVDKVAGEYVANRHPVIFEGSNMTSLLHIPSYGCKEIDRIFLKYEETSDVESFAVIDVFIKQGGMPNYTALGIDYKIVAENPGTIPYGD